MPLPNKVGSGRKMRQLDVVTAAAAVIVFVVVSAPRETKSECDRRN